MGRLRRPSRLDTYYLRIDNYDMNVRDDELEVKNKGDIRNQDVNVESCEEGLAVNKRRHTKY